MLAVRDITLPEPGSTTARQVLSQALGRVARDLVEVCRAAARVPATRKSALAIARMLGVAGGARSGPVISALRHPSCAALVRCLRPDHQASPATRAWPSTSSISS